MVSHLPAHSACPGPQDSGRPPAPVAPPIPIIRLPPLPVPPQPIPLDSTARMIEIKAIVAFIRQRSVDVRVVDGQWVATNTTRGARLPSSVSRAGLPDIREIGPVRSSPVRSDRRLILVNPGILAM